MPTFTLTDTANDLWVESFATQGVGPATPWSVAKRTLRGGRRDGVDLIQVDNGALAFSIIPTRGMGLWKGRYKGLALGWDSPARDGPVHPAFVNLASAGGLGWLDGFDELLVRCGLENNGAPYTEGPTRYGLHGRIGNTPAHFVAVHVGDGPGGEIAIEGHVDESRIFFTQLRMATTVRTAPGSNRVTVRDEFRNLGDSPQELQLLYHWNFGPPWLEDGARFVAAAREIAPRDARAVEGLGHFDRFGAPEPGFAEQVYFYDLAADPSNGQTLVMLRDRDAAKGLVLRFRRTQLPAFTLWKCTGGLQSGYVTGLEPGTNYPNPKPFEKARGRVVTLPPGESYVSETTMEVLDHREAVAAVSAEIEALQKRTATIVHDGPVEPFSTP